MCPGHHLPWHSPRRRRWLIAIVLAIGAAALTNAGTVDLSEHLAACAACHGAQGQGVRGAEYYPHLAGKPTGYLLEQLQGFRDGRRANPQMAWLLQFADDAYLQVIADYYAALPPRTRSADSVADASGDASRRRAETLVEHGDATHGIPACRDCHGPNLAGLDPGVPALLGLPVDYVVAQFGAWREGTRRGAAPDCMHGIATAIAAEDIRAVATWLSLQSNGDGQRPAPTGSFVPPRACGSLPHADPPP